MAKLRTQFTTPSDVDFDRVGVAIATTAAQVVTDANAGTFVFIRDILIPSTLTNIDIFELANDIDLIRGVTYFVIMNPGDADNNFRTDYVLGDESSGVAQRIVDVAIPSSSFEATLVKILKEDAIIVANLKADKNINVILNSGFRAAGNLKTGGSGYGYDDDFNKHFWELMYDIVISEEESFATSDAGDQAWV